VDLTATPLRQLLRRREADRETVAQVLQMTCEQLDIWPPRPVAPMNESDPRRDVPAAD
jgi:hypothetical protein